jgi:hypothetical protein
MPLETVRKLTHLIYRYPHFCMRPHGGEDVYVGLLGCNAVCGDLQVDTNVSEEHTESIFSGGSCSSETLVTYLQVPTHGVTTQKNNIDTCLLADCLEQPSD